MRWILIQEDYQGSEAITVDLTGKKSFLIGTDPQCDLVVSRQLYPSVSRKHAVLEFQPSTGPNGNWCLRDNQSTNGTYVNRKRLLSSHLIMQDDTLMLSIDCLILRLVLVEDESDNSCDLKDGHGSETEGKENNASLIQMSSATHDSRPLLEGSHEVEPINSFAQQHQRQALLSQEKATSNPPKKHDETIGLPSRADKSRDASSQSILPQRSLPKSIGSDSSPSITTLTEAGAIEQESFHTTDDIRALAVDSSSKRLIFATSEKTTIKCIGSDSPIYERINDPKNPVSVIRFSRDGQKIALALRDKSICIMDCELKRELVIFKGHRMGLSDIAFSSDGTHLASCALDKTIRIWGIESGTEEKIIHYQGLTISSIDYNASDKFILAAGRDRIIKRVNLDVSDKVENVVKLSSGVELIRFSKAGLVTTFCSDKTLRIFRLDKPTQPELCARYADQKCIISICNRSRLLAYVESGSCVHLWSLRPSE